MKTQSPRSGSVDVIVAVTRAGWSGRLDLLWREVVAGLVGGLVPLSSCFTFAALIFSGPWEPMLGQGVGVLLLGGAVTAIVVALTSGFRIAVAAPISLTSALLAAMLVHLAPDLVGQPPAIRAATALAAIGAATLATGLSLLALGGLRLGNLVRFTPYPVIAGFMGATGWTMIAGAVRMATDLPVAIASLHRFATPRAGALLAGLLVFTAILFLLTRRFRHPLTIPLALTTATLAIDLALRLSGTSSAAAHEAGLFFDVAGPERLSVPLLSGALAQADWTEVLRSMPYIVPVALIGVVQALVTAASLEVALDTDGDLDRELRSQGWANVASALAGGLVGLISNSYTAANIEAHGRARISPVIAGLLMLATLIGGAGVISIIPRIVLGGMLLMLGTGLLWNWGIASRHRMPLHEWMLTVAMIAVAAIFGFLPALLVGPIGSCILLAASLGRVGVLRHSYGVDESASALQRSEVEMLHLLDRGGEARVIEVGGFLFFGSADRLHARVKSALAAGSVRTLVLDFSSVIGIDASATAMLSRICSLARRTETQLIVSGLQPATARLLQAGKPAVLICTTLDQAIEAAEDAILAPRGPVPATSILDWLAEGFGDAAIAQLLCDHLSIKRCEVGDVLCREGDLSETLLFICSGRVSVTVAAAAGASIRLRVFCAQTIAGEIGFFLGAVRSATMTVERTALVGQLSRTTYQALQASDPAVVAALLEYLARVQAERLTVATGQVVALRRSLSLVSRD